MNIAYLILDSHKYYTDPSNVIVDGGASNIYWPKYDSTFMHELTPCIDKYLTIANDQKLMITGIANVHDCRFSIVPELSKPLISESYLTKNYRIMTIHFEDRLYIYHHNKDSTSRLIATATSRDDGLYVLDNLSDLIEYFKYYDGHDYKSTKPKEAALSISESSTTDKNNSSIGSKPLSNRKVDKHLKGSYTGRLKSNIAGMNPMEVVHCRTGHLPERLILHMAKNEIVNGIGYSYRQLKRHHMETCWADLIGRMHSLPIPPSITTTNNDPDIFEVISFDPKDMPINSIEGYKGFILFVDKRTKLLMVKPYKTISTIPQLLKEIIEEYGPKNNTHSKATKVVILDGSTTHMGKEMKALLESFEHTIRRHVSAPYRHEQNLVERFIQIVMNGVRITLKYNGSPPSFWFKALKYYIHSINNTPVMDRMKSRYEEFWGDKPDISYEVPFYSRGVFYLSDEEIARNALSDRAVPCFMVGYPMDPTLKFKNSYICYIPPNQFLIRHDCHWQHQPDHATLLSLDKYARPYKDILNDDQNDHDTYNQESKINDPLNETVDEPIASRTRLQYDSHNTSNIDKDQIDHDIINDNPYWTEGMDDTIDGLTNDTNPNVALLSQNIERTLIKDELIKQINSLESQQPMNETQTDLSKTNSGYFFHHNNQLVYNEGAIPQCVTNDIWQPMNATLRDTITSKGLEQANLTQSNIDEMHYVHPNLRTNIKQLQNRNKRMFDYELAKQEVEEKVYNPSPPLEYDLPLNLQTALNGKDAIHWQYAWNQETYRLTKRDVWDELPDNSDTNRILSNRKPIKSKYTFRIKYNPDNTIRYKIRLVACGYSQREGIDFDETFSPTAKYESLCTILNVAAVCGYDIQGIDIENAFVEADLDHTIYMTLPTNIYQHNSGKPIVVKLKKSLYGLKQAGELFHKMLHNCITTIDYKQSIHDQCVYIKHDVDTGLQTIIVIYVDDIIITGNDPDSIEATKKHFANFFTKITTDDKLERYIGIDINKGSDGRYELSQLPYTKKVMDRFVSSPIQKSADIPINPNLDYRTLGDESIPPIQDVVGAIRFLADRTRPDLLTAASMLGRGAHNPTNNHIQGAKQLLKFLHGTTDHSVKLGGDNIKLFAMADAAYVPGSDSKSQLGFTFFLNLKSGTICAKSRRDETISHSSTEAEIKAIDMAIIKALWFRGFLEELGFPQNEPTEIITDNHAAKIISEQNSHTEKTAHIVMRINFIHQEVESGRIKLKWINTESNVADILTKPLPLRIFSQHSNVLLNGFDGNPIIPDENSKRNQRKKARHEKIHTNFTDINNDDKSH